MANDIEKLEKVISHRGASAYVPENTLLAFETALDLGSHWVEFDVTLSHDGEAFVFHDDTLNRTTNGKGDFISASSSYIRSLDAGAWFHKKYCNLRIPTLKETLIWLLEHHVHANIEIKSYPTSQLTLTVLEQIEQYWPKISPLPLVSSFDYQALRLCHQKRPDLPLGWLLDKWSDNWLEDAKAIDCFAINLSRQIATQKRIQQIKSAGYAVCVYTVNRRSEAFKLFDWGVNAVFSDYPDLLSGSSSYK